MLQGAESSGQTPPQHSAHTDRPFPLYANDAIRATIDRHISGKDVALLDDDGRHDRKNAAHSSTLFELVSFMSLPAVCAEAVKRACSTKRTATFTPLTVKPSPKTYGKKDNPRNRDLDIDATHLKRTMQQLLPAFLHRVTHAEEEPFSSAAAFFGVKGQRDTLLPQLYELLTWQTTRRSLMNEWVNEDVMKLPAVQQSIDNLTEGASKRVRISMIQHAASVLEANMFRGFPAVTPASPSAGEAVEPHPLRLVGRSSAVWSGDASGLQLDALQAVWEAWLGYVECLVDRGISARLWAAMETVSKSTNTNTDAYRRGLEISQRLLCEEIMYPALVMALHGFGESHAGLIASQLTQSMQGLDAHYAKVKCLCVRQTGVVWMLWIMISVGICLADQGSDIWLGVDHAMNGDTIWAVMTFIFALLPSLVQTFKSLQFDISEFEMFLEAIFESRLCCCLSWAGRKPKAIACLVFTFVFVAAFLFLLVLLFTAILLALGLSPLIGPAVTIYWMYRYFRYPYERILMEANLRAYGMLELLLESIPQLLLQMYIFCVKGELTSLNWFQIIPVALSFLAVVKAAVLGDSEPHRGADFSFRMPPLLLLLGPFRCFDVFVGTVATTTLIVVSRNLIFFFSFACSIMAFPVIAWGLLMIAFAPKALLYEKDSKASKSMKIFFGIMFPFLLVICGGGGLVLMPLIIMSQFLPYITAKVLCCAHHKPLIQQSRWEYAEGASLDILKRVDMLSSFSMWVVTIGPSFMFRLRSPLNPKSFRLFPKWIIQGHDIYPLIATRCIFLLGAFVVALLIRMEVITHDVSGDPLTVGTRLLADLTVYSVLPLIGALCVLTAFDRSQWGHRVVMSMSRVDLLALVKCHHRKHPHGSMGNVKGEGGIEGGGEAVLPV